MVSPAVFIFLLGKKRLDDKWTPQSQLKDLKHLQSLSW